MTLAGESEIGMLQNQIRSYERSIEQSWASFQGGLEDDFSLSAVVRAAEHHGYAIPVNDWGEFFSTLGLPKTKLKLFGPMNDNGIQELATSELDYVIGGVAAVPVAAVVIAVFTYAAVFVSVAAAGVIVVFAGASIVAAATVSVTVSS
jgi:hypothetical protein